MRFGRRNESSRLANLLSLFCDGRLTEDDTAELRTMLEGSRQARRYYLHYLDMHLDLVRRAEIEQIIPMTASTVKKPAPFWWRPWVQAAAAMLVLGALLGVGMLVRPNQTPAEQMAFVSRADGVEWASAPVGDIDVGSVLPAGRVHLKRGDLRLDLFNGVAVTLRGPVDCEFTSVDEIVLNRGQLAVLVPESASGFAVRTPNAVIFDIGTEFALNVLPNETCQVHVVDGEVIASLSGMGGATLEQSIQQGQAFEINPASHGMHAIEPDTQSFVAMLLPAPKPLPITAAYVAAVKKAQPIGYWRFEQVVNGVVPNEMSESHAARAFDEQAFALDGNEANKVAVMPAGVANGGLRVDDPFPELNVAGQYTIELWMNPLKHDWSTLASLIRPDMQAQTQKLLVNGQKRFEPHLMSLECMPPLESNCCIDHEPRVLRCYQLRSCSGRGPNQSANLFSKRQYVPGQWRHLAVTRDGSKLRLYLDGELERQGDIEIKPDDSDYLLLIGRYSRQSKRFAKLFSGRLDEVALYDRALSANEVARHFSLVRP